MFDRDLRPHNLVGTAFSLILGAKLVVKQAISTAEVIFGDMSLQSGELYELMGNILFAEHKLPNALSFFVKAEEIFRGKKRFGGKQDMGQVESSNRTHQEIKTR